MRRALAVGAFEQGKHDPRAELAHRAQVVVEVQRDTPDAAISRCHFFAGVSEVRLDNLINRRNEVRERFGVGRKKLRLFAASAGRRINQRKLLCEL